MDNYEKTKRLFLQSKTLMQQNGITKCVIPSTTGKTAVIALEFFPVSSLVIVRKCFGASSANTQDMEPSIADKLSNLGVPIITATHVFGGIGRSIRNRYNTWQIDELMANVLRIFGTGIKVAVEITLMATDAGYLNSGDVVLAFGGNKFGVCQVAIIKCANTHAFFDLEVRHIFRVNEI